MDITRNNDNRLVYVKRRRIKENNNERNNRYNHRLARTDLS